MSRRLAVLLCLALFGVPALSTAALSEPAPPSAVAAVARLEHGVFCALQAMDQRPAPGTLTGWIHVPDSVIDFHWPDRQVVPAQIGLAFGVKSRMAPGLFLDGEMRVYRPGSPTPETWDSTFTDLSDQFAFFRFDHDHELIPGPWRFEAWAGDEHLFTVPFEVVPADALPEIAQACGAIA